MTKENLLKANFNISSKDLISFIESFENHVNHVIHTHITEPIP